MGERVDGYKEIESKHVINFYNEGRAIWFYVL